MIVLFHMHNWSPAIWRPPGAYLAVDLFFGLSGFVLAEAYSVRLDAGYPWIAFMRKRIVRLWPLYAVGLLIGAAPLTLKILHREASPSAIAPAILGFFYCPSAGPGGVLYPLNIPAWSLLYELIINAVMAFAWRRLTQRSLILVVALAAAGLVACAAFFGSLDAGATWATAPAALCRVTFSFFLGILLWRAKPKPLALSAWAPILALGAALAADGGPVPRALLDLGEVFLLFPLIIWLGAATSPRGPSLLIFEAVGAASYALYALHVPLLGPIFTLVAKALNTPRGGASPLVGGLVLGGLFCLAWLANGLDVRLRAHWSRTREREARGPQKLGSEGAQ